MNNQPFDEWFNEVLDQARKFKYFGYIDEDIVYLNYERGETPKEAALCYIFELDEED